MKQIFLFFAVLALMVVFNESVNAQSNGKASQPKGQNTDKPLKIKKTSRPRARGCKPGTGQATFLVTFHKSGAVTNVKVLSLTGCDVFDRNAAEAAQKIKFEPAVTGGVAVSIIKPVEYTYTVF